MIPIGAGIGAILGAIGSAKAGIELANNTVELLTKGVNLAQTALNNAKTAKELQAAKENLEQAQKKLAEAIEYRNAMQQKLNQLQEEYNQLNIQLQASNQELHEERHKGILQHIVEHTTDWLMKKFMSSERAEKAMIEGAETRVNTLYLKANLAILTGEMDVVKPQVESLLREFRGAKEELAAYITGNTPDDQTGLSGQVAQLMNRPAVKAAFEKQTRRLEELYAAISENAK